MRTILALGLAGMAATPALAGLEICNDSRTRQSVAIGHMVGGVWTSEGWWNIAPGACAEPVGGDLANRYYYYRAEAGGARFEDDGVFFCTRDEAFTIPGQGECAARGHDREGFRRIDTGRTATAFTLRLGGGAPATPPERDAPSARAETGVLPLDSGLAPGRHGEPVTETARFQGCGEDDGGPYCAFHAAGRKWYAYRGGPTPAAVLDGLRALPVGTAVALRADILSFGDISIEMAVTRVTGLPGGGPHEDIYRALQGRWVPADDPAYRVEVHGSEMTEYSQGRATGTFFWRLAEGCDAAPPGAGPALLKTEPETGETFCYLPDRITAGTWEMFYAGRGNLLRFRRE